MVTARSTHGKIMTTYKRVDLKHEGKRQLRRPKGKWGNAINIFVIRLRMPLMPETLLRWMVSEYKIG